MRKQALLSAVLLFAPLLSCSASGTTGYALVSFYAAGAGFAGATTKDAPFSFDAGGGVTVTLTQASLHVGAMYLTQSVPQAGGGPQPCVLPQTYAGAFVGQVRGDADVDLLDGATHGFPVTGDGSSIAAANGEIWLTHAGAITDGNLNGPDGAPVLSLVGVFTDAAGASHSFSAGITIDTSRIVAKANTGLPGEVQICQQRIVSGIPAGFALAQSGQLVLHVDARALFEGVRFTDLPDASSVASGCLAGTSTDRCFTNDSTNASSTTLYANLTSTGPYRFAWVAPGP
jgi:hypothetical protein